MLELVAEDVTPEDAGSIAGKQINLEHIVTDMMTEYKRLKLKIFIMVQRCKSARDPSARLPFPN